ncbi:hypothetical protein GCM10023259_098360 [Thermocatellispora tengchongensis]
MSARIWFSRWQEYIRVSYDRPSGNIRTDPNVWISCASVCSHGWLPSVRPLADACARVLLADDLPGLPADELSGGIAISSLLVFLSHAGPPGCVTPKS